MIFNSVYEDTLLFTKSRREEFFKGIREAKKLSITGIALPNMPVNSSVLLFQ